MHVPRSQYQAPILDYYSGQKPKLWDDQQPVEHFLGELSKRSWMRVEYLHWSFDGPHNVHVGAPVNDLTSPLIVTTALNNDPQAGNYGVGQIPPLGALSLSDIPGVRGTWGLDLSNAEFELQVFGTGQADDSFAFTNIAGFRTQDPNALPNETTSTVVGPGVTVVTTTTLTDIPVTGTEASPNYVIPLLSNGSVADASGANYLVFDESLSSSFSSQMWGAEASFLTKPYIPGEGFHWQWLGGFRYISYDEEASVQGRFRNGVANVPGNLTHIAADSTNSVYGPEVGFRSSIVHRWFSVSATPRIAFAINDYSGTTSFNGNMTDSAGDVEFSPIVQVGLSGELHLTPNFSVFGGYDFMWMTNVSRPFENIVYDSGDANNDGIAEAQIRQEIDLTSLFTQGLSIGGVFRY